MRVKCVPSLSQSPSHSPRGTGGSQPTLFSASGSPTGRAKNEGAPVGTGSSDGTAEGESVGAFAVGVALGAPVVTVTLGLALGASVVSTGEAEGLVLGETVGERSYPRPYGSKIQ